MLSFDHALYSLRLRCPASPWHRPEPPYYLLADAFGHSGDKAPQCMEFEGLLVGFLRNGGANNRKYYTNSNPKKSQYPDTAFTTHAQNSDDRWAKISDKTIASILRPSTLQEQGLRLAPKHCWGACCRHGRLESDPQASGFVTGPGMRRSCRARRPANTGILRGGVGQPRAPVAGFRVSLRRAPPCREQRTSPILPPDLIG